GSRTAPFGRHRPAARQRPLPPCRGRRGRGRPAPLSRPPLDTGGSDAARERPHGGASQAARAGGANHRLIQSFTPAGTVRLYFFFSPFYFFLARRRQGGRA